MGLLYGLVHIISPDHLGTLMTLSTVASNQSAFKAGAAWGLGHSVGMVMVAGICIMLHHFVKLDLELWEHFGNYFIGVSMVICSLYFILRESSFLKEEADGSFVAQPCFCHGPAASTLKAQPSICRPVSKPRPWNFRPILMCQACDEEEAEAASPPSEADPLLPQQCAEESQGRSWMGALLGLCQGICCPVSMVGVTFLAGLPARGIVAFLIVFITLSAFGTAALAMGWAFFTSKGLARNVSTRTLYRASCGFTLSLGVGWLVANSLGVISKLDYAEGLAN